MSKTVKFVFLLIGMAVTLTVGALFNSGPDPVELEQRRYCEMVKLNRADPTIGWPDYNRNYDEVCINEQSAR